MPVKLTQKQFIDHANDVHGHLYDYSRSIYLGDKVKVEIICSVHGSFYQTPNNHVKSKRYCPACGNESKSINMRVGIKQFIERARKIHGDRYDYSLVEYIDGDTPVKIICKEHGIFHQAPGNHTHSAQGCYQCSLMDASIRMRLTQQQFLDKSLLAHGDKYDYTNSQYVGGHQLITIRCKRHGNFTQTAYSHTQGTGCPSCARTSFSKKAISWLDYISQHDSIHIQHAQNGGEFIIPTTRLKADGYCKETNTVYEFHGDIWHGNPRLYSADERCHPYNVEITAGELYKRTIERENKIKQLGYNLVVCWESEFNALNIS